MEGYSPSVEQSVAICSAIFSIPPFLSDALQCNILDVEDFSIAGLFFFFFTPFLAFCKFNFLKSHLQRDFASVGILDLLNLAPICLYFSSRFSE